MRRLLQIGVIFLLAVSQTQAADAKFTLLTHRPALPSGAAGKPIWFATRLTDGRLGVSFEGGIALGYPNGKWQQWATPNGSPARILVEGHGQIWVGGAGFLAQLEPNQLRIIDSDVDREVSIAMTPDGWLVGCKDGLRFFDLDGNRVTLDPSTEALRHVRVLTVDHQIWVTAAAASPHFWNAAQRRLGDRVPDVPTGPLYLYDRHAFMTSTGIIDGIPPIPLPESVNRQLLAEGIVGFARTDHQLIVGTYRGGIHEVSLEEKTILHTWKGDVDLYSVNRSPTGLLIGTSDALEVAINPAEALYRKLDGHRLFGMKWTAEQELQLFQFDQTATISADGEAKSTPGWTTADGTAIMGTNLRFQGHSADLRTKLVDGLAALPEAAMAIHFGGATLLSSSGEVTRIKTPSEPTGIAVDRQNFYVSTEEDGVSVFNASGRLLRQFGSGRSNAIQLRAHDVVLTFWDGSIIDHLGRRLGQIPLGHPTDVTPFGNDLAVLLTRADHAPVVGLLSDGRWIPLALPGLAKVEASHLVASPNHLFAAGSGGIVRMPLPLPRATAPEPIVNWSAPLKNQLIQLGAENVDHVRVTMFPEDLPPAPSTRLRFRLTDREWQDVTAGMPIDINVPWGRSAVEIEAERNGLTTRQNVTIMRPYPWWLRAWAWPLHIGTVVALILIGVRFRTNRLQRRNAELEQRVVERTEALRKANAVKEEFLAGISHEIRNPLNGVVGICAMLADRDVGPREQMLVRTLGGCADQLRSMLDDILDFSRLERGQLTLTNVDFELRALVEESARVMDPEMTRCTLILPDDPVWLHGDSGKFRQLVCNLVSNALKYGEPAEAGIEAQIERTDTGRARLRLAVRNTGPTIPADDLPRLFESFQRGHGAAVDRQPGSGLGLAVCRRLVQAMDGRIFAASDNGLTEFVVEVILPAALPPATIERTEVAQVSHALAVEDEDYNRIALGHVLRGMGYSVDWAADATTALQLAANRAYDLILTDWRLPDMNGDELCRHLLNLQPEPKPPVIAVTAYAADEKLQAAINAGMTGFVTKPVTPEKLRDVVRRLSSGLQPKRSLDTRTLGWPQATAVSPLASLGRLAPSASKLAEDINDRWQAFSALAELHDPRAANTAHALRSLLLLANESIAAEQAGLLEAAADRDDRKTLAQLVPFAAEEIRAACDRLRAE